MSLKVFLYTGVLLACLSSCKHDKPASLPYTYDGIYFNGQILTMEGDSATYVEAVVVKNGKILFAGTLTEAQKLKEPQMLDHDLNKATMLPGFVDGHSHFSEIGFQAAAADLLPAPEGNVNDFETLKKKLRTYVDTASKDPSSIVEKHNIIIGMNYDDTQLKEQYHPTRRTLDSISDTIPIMIIHQSGHLCVLNTAAIQKAQLDTTTVNPDGGVIRREPSPSNKKVGYPNGVLEETAFFIYLRTLYPQFSTEESVKLFAVSTHKYVEQGFTTVQDGKTNVENLGKLLYWNRMGGLDIDVVAYPDLVAFPAYQLDSFVSKKYAPNKRFRVGGVKLTLDGSPQGKTAWFSKPYLKNNTIMLDDNGKPYNGYAAFQDTVLRKYLDTAFTNKWQLLAHCNGDAASSQLLSEMKKYKQLSREEHRTTIIHGQFMTEAQIDTAKVAGIFVSLFPMHTYNWGDVHWSALGKARAENLSPTGWFRDRSMKFSIHSDAPVIFPASMPLIATAMDRTTRTGRLLGGNHRLDPYIALQAMTIWPAYQHFEEDTKGSIKVGKLADFVILDKNPLHETTEVIKKIRVLATIKEGKTIFGKIPSRDPK